MIAKKVKPFEGFDLCRFLNGSSRLGTRRSVAPSTSGTPPYGSKPASRGSLGPVGPRNFFERERRLVLSMTQLLSVQH